VSFARLAIVAGHFFDVEMVCRLFPVRPSVLRGTEADPRAWDVHSYEDITQRQVAAMLLISARIMLRG
jgi:hypothetical protein